MGGVEFRRVARTSRRGEGWTDLFEDVASDVRKRNGSVDITDIYMSSPPGLSGSPN